MGLPRQERVVRYARPLVGEDLISLQLLRSVDRLQAGQTLAAYVPQADRK